MSNYVLSSCSTVDLTPAKMKEMDVPFVNFHLKLGDGFYNDDMGQEISTEEIYTRMLAGEDAKTSQVSMVEYKEFFEKFLKEGKDVLHIVFSSGLSGSINSARLAQEELQEEYPDRKIYIIDSLAASAGHGLLVAKAASLKKEGMSIDDLFDWIEEHKLEVHHWFYSTDLTFFIKGGRVSKGAGLVGNMLGICPLLNVDWEGHLIPREKIRGKKKVMARTLQMMKDHAQDGTNYSGKCFISHSDMQEGAETLASMIEEAFPNLDGKVEIYPIGPTIGCHTGPGTIALFFWGDKREEE